MFSIFGKNFYFGGDMLHNFQNNTSKRAPGNTEYFQFGTGITHTIDDFYNNDICVLTVEEFNIISEVIPEHTIVSIES